MLDSTRRSRHAAAAFTIVELLVVIGVIALLMGLLFPTISRVREGARQTECANNLRQIGQATISYLAVHRNHLPQVAVEDPFNPGNEVIIGALFGGKKGTLPFYGIDQIGAEDRPLNAYLGDGYTDEDVPVFNSPMDRGQPPILKADPPQEGVDSMYDYIGTSYNLNDHSLDSEACATLVPQRTGDRPGGRMPNVSDPSLTWMIAPVPVYNYQQGGDRRQEWHSDGVFVNMCFVDGHVKQAIEMQPATYDDNGFIEQNLTKHYSFLPTRNWLELHCGDVAGP